MTDIVLFPQGLMNSLLLTCDGNTILQDLLTKSIYYLNNNPILSSPSKTFFSPQLTVSLPCFQAGQISSLEMHPFWMVRFVFLNPHEV